MNRIYSIALVACLFLISCNSKPSLEKYFVENSENKDFILLDISPSILNIDKTKLTVEQNEALHSFQKMNILVFKQNDKNNTQFETEREKVNAILKHDKYQQLIKIGSGKDGASVSFVGTDDHIEEFVLYANNKGTGFAVVRILGKDMNPANIMTIVSVLVNSNINLEQLKPLQEMFKK